MELTEEQTNTIFFALRLWKLESDADFGPATNLANRDEARLRYINTIAFNSGIDKPLTLQEIDNLCLDYFLKFQKKKMTEMSKNPEGYELCPNCESALELNMDVDHDSCVICHGKGIVEMEKKPRLQLSGEDGNVFFILGRAQRVAKKAEWSQDKWQEFYNDATSGNYDHALQTCMKYFDVH